VKKKLGLYWAASCGGCEIAVLEIHERLFELLDEFEIVFWPCVMDVKRSDVERMADEAIDVCLFNGAIRHEENAHMASLLRRKSKVLVAYGACAATGGVPGLANLYPRRDLLDRMYITTESTENQLQVVPKSRTEFGGGRELTLPAVYPSVRSLGQIVPVDY
jgi:F420-non-reducing hydrogenase small subunit